VEERERVAGGGDAAAGERAALDVLEGDEPGGLGRGGEVAEDVLEEALVAGERDGARAGAGREAVLLLRLPEQLPEHRVVQVRRPHHEPPRRAAHAHRHVVPPGPPPRPRPPPPLRAPRRGTATAAASAGATRCSGSCCCISPSTPAGSSSASCAVVVAAARSYAGGDQSINGERG
jgi:hypothetical protein